MKTLLLTCCAALLPLAAPAAETNAGPVEVFTASADWQAIRWEPARIVKGSALDFSSFLAAPAGRSGAVICRDGRFVFQNAPDQPVRIYGADVTHGLPFMDKPHGEQFADYLAACGYSGVRLHNYNFAKGVMKDVGSAEFTPEALDQLDYFFACLKKHGLYYTFPLNAWGFFKAGDVTDVPEFRGRAFRFESNGLLSISADLQRWFKAYALQLLGHTNPYTGLALKDDPALLSLELANEDSLLAVLGQFPEFVPIYRNKCCEHLLAGLGRKPTADQVEQALPRFVLQLQDKYFQAMKSFLRDAGVRQPLTDLNFRDNLIYALPRSQLDYVDIHAYWALYHNLPVTGKSAGLAYRQNWINPNTVGWVNFLGPVAGRLFGKPYMNSEFNSCYPTPYWIFTAPIEAVLAGGQGWNGVFRCGLTAHPDQFFTATPVSRLVTCASPLMMFSERIGALLFAQGEVQPLPVKVPFVVTPDYLHAQLDLAGGPKYPACYQQFAFQYQLGTIVLDGTERLDGYPCLVAPPDMPLPGTLAGKTVLRADASLSARLKQLFPAEPPLHMDTASGSAQLVTPRSETFLLPADVGNATGHCVALSGNRSVAVCFAGSLDGRPLADSKRVLALYLTDLKNTGTTIEHEAKPKDSVIVRKPGQLPLLVRQGLIEVTFKLKDRPLPQVWALKYDGTRAVQLEPRRTADGFSIEMRAVTNPETFAAFELVWN
jgi:hypothetical protein